MSRYKIPKRLILYAAVKNRRNKLNQNEYWKTKTCTQVHIAHNVVLRYMPSELYNVMYYNTQC